VRCDPSLLNPLAGCGGFLSTYCNNPAQPYLDAGGATLDQVQRDVDYQQADAILRDDPYAIYLYQLESLTGLNRDVHGWKPHATSYFLLTNAQLGG
jgi:ABC-type transport system substrate-binding protein